MRDETDQELLAQFVRNGSEAAFAELVERHIGLVYSVALRHTARSDQARDISQAVFIILARKAKSLSRRVVISGWLYHTARLTAANHQRAEWRRNRREREAAMRTILEETPDDRVWQELSPMLDEAMSRLKPADRDVIILRYFENKNLEEVGVALGLQERAAQKRVARSLDKLRAYFEKHGMEVPSSAVGKSIANHALQAAPPGLAPVILSESLKTGAGSGTAAALVKSTLKIMAWTKTKVLLVTGGALLLAAGTTTVTVRQIQEHQTQDWQLGRISSDTLLNAPHRTVILPSKYTQRPPEFGTGGMVWMADGRCLGINHSVKSMMQVAFNARSFWRVVDHAQLPTSGYDFLSNQKDDSRKALQQAIQQKFGVTGRFEQEDMDVLLLKVKHSPAPGLRPARGGQSGSTVSSDRFSVNDESLDGLLLNLEDWFQIPVLDRTGLTGRFDMEMNWSREPSGDPDLESLKQALLDRLGLELVSAREPLEVLVVERSTN